MKRILVLFVVMLMGASLVMGDNFFYRSAGTTDFGVTFSSKAQGFAVMSSAEDITVYAYVGTTVIDTITVLGGSSMFLYCPANSLYVDRTASTAVSINPTYNNYITPNMSINQSPLAEYLSGPTPVSVSEHNLFTGLKMDWNSAGSATNLNKVGGGDAYAHFPVTAGVDVHGAKALYLVLDWTDIDACYFKIEHKFSPSSTDTTFDYYDGSSWSFQDSIVIADSALTGAGGTALTIPPNVAGSLVLRVPDVPGAGYYFVKITNRDKVWANMVNGLNGTLVVVQ